MLVALKKDAGDDGSKKRTLRRLAMS